MNTVIAEVSDDVIVVPAETIERLGWHEDTNIILEKHNGKFVFRAKKLTADEIADIAGTYLVKYVGDATDVKPPVWQGGKWRVEVVLSYRRETTVGFLTFSPDGHLVESESDSPAKMKGFRK
jgi:antitoxin component of MazEF toxin-antitoxin module